MNRVEKIRILDERVTWDLLFHPNQRFEFSSYDTLSNFLKNEYRYWEKYEKGFGKEAFRYSSWFEKCLGAVNDTLKHLDVEKLSPTELFSQLQTQFTNHEIENVQNARYSSDNVIVQISTSKVLCSGNNDPGAIAYAYETFYSEEKSVFDDFVLIVEKQDDLRNYLMKSSSESQVRAAVSYIGFQLRANKYPSRNLINKEQIIDLKNEMDVVVQSLAERRTDVDEFLDSSRATFNKQYDDEKREIDKFREEVDAWYKESIANVNTLEKTYKEKLHLSAPVEHWKEQADKKNKSFRIWLAITAVMCVALLIIAANLVSFILDQASVIENIAEASPLYYVPQYFVFVAIITFLVYIIRIFVKITMSEKHMQAEYSQKEAFTYFYLSLLQNSDGGIAKEERPIILSALFSRVDTGLIKSEGKTETDAGLMATLLNR